MNERRMVNASLFAWYLCLMLMLVFFGRCSSGDVATSPDVVALGDVGVEASPAGGGPVAGGEEEVGTAPGDCDAVGLKRAGVRWQVDGRHQLLLFVPMSPVIGEAYVNVWTPGVNTTFLGRGPANEWFGVSLPHFGSWRIQLAAETIDHTGRVRQCDTHRFQVVAKPPPPMPPPPPKDTCEEVETPRCEASVEASLGEFPSVWFFTDWEVEDWCGKVELTRDDGFVLFSEDVCAECVVGEGEVVSGKKMSDTNDPESFLGTWSLVCKQG